MCLHRKPGPLVLLAFLFMLLNLNDTGFPAELGIDSDPRCFALSTVGFSVMKSIMGDDGVPHVNYSDYFKFCGIERHPPLSPILKGG